MVVNLNWTFIPSPSRVGLDSQKSSRLYSNWRLSNMQLWEGDSVLAEQWRRVTPCHR